MLVVYSMHGVFASAKDYAFEKPELGLVTVKLKYHKAMNDYFNKKIKLFLKTDPSNENYSIPSDLEACTENEKNVSTYCVAMGALNMYEAYAKTLDAISPLITEIEDEATAPVVGNVPGTVANLFSAIATTKSKIAEEKTNAMKVMDMTVSAYNEFRLAYPVHLKYELITKELYTYVNNLKKLRQTLYSFPAKFINSSSQSCK